ncbi:leucine carboxyl methyltransferase 2-like [Stylonychia lemnae]|uniref:Leucine carboxyl methyltransferase 1 n=1 Tax=Stylonychia lemnae TaxID=5949 RepID=A0A078BCK3_STYLE|nr:leucine carboxyl methyltransferase 2-like [Stylonychia lemnae]|eukprot:CDW90937.1 leucine carboxyl methyltransferase 2-like [Stylonychia lemnae]
MNSFISRRNLVAKTMQQLRHQTMLSSLKSAANLGYFKDDYSQLFLRSKKKLLPIMNRGTWARVFSIRSILLRFLNAYQNADKVNIMIPGAGYDTTFFCLQDLMREQKIPQNLQGKITVIEIDFFEVISKKIQIIKKHQNLVDMIRLESEQDIEVIHEKHINSHQYKVFCQDIREIELLQTNMANLGVDFNAPTLVITECLLVYLKKAESDSILKGLSQIFQSDLVYVNYEMIHPGDAFGRVMIENLEILRMKEQGGMSSADCYNMSQIYAKRLESTERHRIEKLEIFDEFEEWELLSKHYCLCLGKRIAEPSIDEQIII